MLISRIHPQMFNGLGAIVNGQDSLLWTASNARQKVMGMTEQQILDVWEALYAEGTTGASARGVEVIWIIENALNIYLVALRTMAGVRPGGVYTADEQRMIQWASAVLAGQYWGKWPTPTPGGAAAPSPAPAPAQSGASSTATAQSANAAAAGIAAEQLTGGGSLYSGNALPASALTADVSGEVGPAYGSTFQAGMGSSLEPLTSKLPSWAIPVALGVLVLMVLKG